MGLSGLLSLAALQALAACAADSEGSGRAHGLSVCGRGQSAGCVCADGQLPALTGCEAAPAVAGASSGGLAGAAGAGTPVNTAAASGSGGSAPAAVGQAGGAVTGTPGAPLMAAGASGAPTAPAGVPGAGMAASAGSPAGAGSAGILASAGMSAAGSGGLDPATACGEGGMMGKASSAGAAQGRGAGDVEFTVSAGNQLLRLQTTMEVPVKPDGNMTLFLWPGIEPLQGGANYNPIGTGVLQPVLTWGGSCAPGSPSTRVGDRWWISSQYVNPYTSDTKHRGCFGGPTMDVEIGEQLYIDMRLKEGTTIWNQAVTDLASGKTVDFDMDMAGQEQRWALFEIEIPTSTKPASDVVFTNTVLTFSKAEPKACQPSGRGTNDAFSTPISSADGLRCCVARLVLRAAGVAATTQDR